MKLDVEVLSQISDTFLFEYLKEEGDYLTKSELHALIAKRELKLFIGSGYDKKTIIDEILNKVSLKIIAEAINSSSQKRWQIIKDLLEFDDEFKVNFMREYGKYLSKDELITIIKNDCKEEPKTYEEMLIDLYLQQKHLVTN